MSVSRERAAVRVLDGLARPSTGATIVVVLAALACLRYVVVSTDLPDAVTSLWHEVFVRGVLLNRMFIAVAAILALECAVLGWSASSARQILVRRTASTDMDVALFGLQLLGLMPYATLAVTLGLGYLAGVVSNEVVSSVARHDLRLRTGFFATDIAIYFLVSSFVEYWNHRLLHTRYFWPLHRIHHSAGELNGITSWRNHPALFAWEPFLRMWVTAFLWAPPGFMALLGAHQFLVHTRLPWSWGIVGRFILVSPLNHRLHHSADPRHANANFSVYLVVWDRLFGTYRGDARGDETLGLAEGPDGASSFRSLVSDMKNLLRSRA